MLPKGCIRKIESLCSRFLWSGKTDSPTCSKVSWETVCLPKDEGGLGLRRFQVWNKTLILRLVWLLFSESGSLWVAWHKQHDFNSSYHFWSQVESSTQSWSWRCILRSRPVAAQFLVSEVKNGSKTSFWFDNWSPLGPLIKCIGADGPRRLRLSIDATVSNACNTSGWLLPHPRSDQEVQLHAFISVLRLPSTSPEEDCYKWRTIPEEESFSTAKTWEVLRPRGEEQRWASFLWFKGATPKHAFNMWIAHLNRLPTRARLANWGMQIPTTCCLCTTAVETRDHLLISCQYATTIWLEVSRRIRISQPLFTTWTGLMSWANSNSNAPPNLKMLVAQAVIYNIWRQRNNVLFNQTLIPPMSVFKDINRQVLNAIHARRRRKNFINFMAKWLI